MFPNLNVLGDTSSSDPNSTFMQQLNLMCQPQMQLNNNQRPNKIQPELPAATKGVKKETSVKA